MDKKLVTIILAIALIACFFLAWFSFFGITISAYDMIFSRGGNDWQRYLLLIIPASGVLLFFGAINNGSYMLGRGLLSWLPLLTLIYVLIIRPVVDGSPFGDVVKALGKGYGVGLWIALVASLVLAFYNPKR